MNDELIDVEPDSEYLNFQDEFEADVVIFSDLDDQARNELEALADFGYININQ